MSGSATFDLIERIAAEPSTNAKLALVKEGVQSPFFCRVLEYALDPTKTFYFTAKTLPEWSPAHHDTVYSGMNWRMETWALLDMLASRALSGAAALTAVQLELNLLDQPSANLLRRVILKDLRAGFGSTITNKACKGLIPEFPYMRCSLPKHVKLEAWPWAKGVFSQEKADGMFANVDYSIAGGSKQVSIRSRQGSEFPIGEFAQIADEVRQRFIGECQYHGEFLVEVDGVVAPREIGNGIMNRVLSGGSFEANERPTFKVWDVIPLSDVKPKGKNTRPYTARVADLITMLRSNPVDGAAISLIETRVVRTLADAYAHSAELMKKGKEGTVVKHPGAIWFDGTSKELVKLKLEFEIDLTVTAIVEGRSGTKNEGRAGSLTCESSDGLLRVDVAVKNEAMRDKVDANTGDWVGRVIAVVANDIMTPSESNELHSLFLPRMVEATYRTDKTEADDLERINAAKEAAILGQAILKAAV